MSRLIKKPIAVQMRAAVGREFWVLKMEELCKEVTEKAGAAHVKDLAEWEAAK